MVPKVVGSNPTGHPVMKASIFRALFAIVAGVLLIKYREEMVKWLTIAVGVVFFISGIISIISYCVRRNSQEKPVFPIVGIGCAALGIILALIPYTVAEYLVYVFAFVLILGAVSQFVLLIRVRLSYGFWVMPILLFLFGLLAIFYPHAIASAPFVFVGVAAIVYGCSEFVSAVKAHRVAKTTLVAEPINEQKQIEAIHPIEDAEIVEETEAETPAEAPAEEEK